MEATSNEKNRYRGAILLTLGGFISGAAIGWTKGVLDLQSLSAETTKQGETLCGAAIWLIFSPLFFAFILGLIGTLPGIAAAVRVYRKRTSRLKSDWQAYYGK